MVPSLNGKIKNVLFVEQESMKVDFVLYTS